MLPLSRQNFTAKARAINFDKIVHFHRKQAGLSRLELARLAGVGKTALYELEKGKPTVRLDILLKVLSTLNIKLDWNSPLKVAMEGEAKSVNRRVLVDSGVDSNDGSNGGSNGGGS